MATGFASGTANMSSSPAGRGRAEVSHPGEQHGLSSGLDDGAPRSLGPAVRCLLGRPHGARSERIFQDCECHQLHPRRASLAARVAGADFRSHPGRTGSNRASVEQDDEPRPLCTWNRTGLAQQEMLIRQELVQQAIGNAAPSSQRLRLTAPAEHVLCVPLVAVERILGVIYLSSPASSPAFPRNTPTS
jgi:hypothetical protein